MDFGRSDLARECGCETDGKGVRVQRCVTEGSEILRIKILDEEAAARVGKPRGRYTTLECGKIHLLGERESEQVLRDIAVEIRAMAERMTEKRVWGGFSVLVVGLGNRSVTPDALGPETVRHLAVTRHLKQHDASLFSTVGLCEISATVPGVLGETGLETLELVRGAALTAKPDLVIAVDALAARSVERLANTVQIADVGIVPGSGLGERREPLSRETVGVPVMSLGVPTVVESATLVYDALKDAGMGEEGEKILQKLRKKGTFFVAPKEVDMLVKAAGALLAGAIEKAFAV